MSRFNPRFEELPEVLPIFPLPGALLLPGGQLPLNIFEPRYLAMVSAALRGDRLIGMVQPIPKDIENDQEDVGAAPVFATGCAGRITAFGETDDGCYLITLTGLLRFKVMEELAPEDGYRRICPNWSLYCIDLDQAEEPSSDTRWDRGRLLDALRGYFTVAGLQGDWESIRSASDSELVTALAMLCPFDVREKQALLEAATLGERAETMTALLEMASLEQGDALRH